MSDDADEREAAEAEAEAQAQVSRLLAAARHDEPAPPDVVARIEAALAAEAATTPQVEPSPAPVADLESRRRRRRRLRTGLLAAAVVVVAGVGVGAVVQEGLGGGAGSQDSAGSTSAEAPAPESQQPPGALDQDEAAPEVPDVMGARAPLPRVRTGATLPEDVARALRTGSPLPATRARCAPAEGADRSAAAEVVRVLADGSRAELLVGPTEEGRRTVSLHPCGGPEADPLATVVVPAP